MRRWVTAIVLVLLAGAATAARILGYRLGLLHETSQLTVASIAVSLTVAAAIIALYWAVTRRSVTSGGSQVGSPVNAGAQAVSFVTVALGVYSLLTAVLPNSIEQAAAPACRGVVVAGAHTLGQTVTGGVSARAGAGTVYDQVDRFGGGCTVGFDGFCVGEAIGNELTNVDDQRWLIVHRRHEVISAAEVRLQSPQRGLGEQPSSRCDEFDGRQGPTSIRFSTARSKAGLYLNSDAPRAAVVGYGIEFTTGFAPGAYPFKQIGIRPADVAVQWNSVVSAARLIGSSGTVYLSAVPCYADDFIVSGVSAFRRITFADGKITSNTATGTVPQQDLLVRAACAGP